MPVMSSQSDVENFLSDMRAGISAGKAILIPRKKNLDTLAKLGILPKDAFQEAQNLSFADYICGPEIDQDFPNTDKLWVFKTMIDSNCIYIKVKVEYQVNGKVKFLSFHFDEPGH